MILCVSRVIHYGNFDDDDGDDGDGDGEEKFS